MNHLLFEQESVFRSSNPPCSMERRSIKRPPQVEKDSTGCMWPIISLFDFHQSPPAPRLLSDVRPASSRRGGRDYSKIKLDISGRNEDKGENVKKVTGTKAKGDAASFASVKTLMKEEMLQERSNKYELNYDSDFNNQTRPPSLGFESYSENARLSQDDIMSSKKGHQIENEDMVNKQNRSRFFWSKDKSKEIGSPKKSEDLDTQNQASVENLRTRTKEQKIKSSPNFSRPSHCKTGDEEGDRVMFNFSLREMKRKIKSIIGGSKKERRAVSMDGILHKIPIGHKDRAVGEKLLNNDSVVASSESKSLHDKERPSIVSPIASSVINNNRIRNDISVTKSTPPIYEEAKKHLVDMLDAKGPRTRSRTAHVSKSLGKLFSIQEDDALRMKMSHKGEKEIVLTSEEAVSIPLQKFDEDANNSLIPSKQNVEVLSCSIDCQNDEILGLKTEIANKCVVSDPNHAGNVQNVETVDAVSKLLNDQSDASSESNSNEAAVACAVLNEDLAHSMIQSVPSSYRKESFETPESPINKPGRSPVSIFEKFIPDDFTIPKLRAVNSIFPTKEERTTSRTYFANRKARIKYIEVVLEASGLRAIDFSRWHLANNLLEQSVFDEVGISCYQQIDDLKLLFDGIYEALKQIQEKFFKCTPWVSLLSSNVLLAPAELSLSKEVDRIITRHIPMDFSDSIDPIVTSDMEIGRWMDIQFETEEVVLEIWDTALDDLVEEAIFDLWLDLSADW